MEDGSWKAHKVVELLKSKGFWHDAADMVEKPLEEILAEYDVRAVIAQDAGKQLFIDLYRMAEENQTSEISYKVLELEPR
jgi:hypothetical protein